VDNVFVQAAKLRNNESNFKFSNSFFDSTITKEAMKIKLSLWLVFVLVCPFIAGFYGIIHDHLSYAISPEYFTKFKFEQYRLWEGKM
jgi:hypothetical protein